MVHGGEMNVSSMRTRAFPGASPDRSPRPRNVSANWRRIGPAFHRAHVELGRISLGRGVPAR